MPPLLAVGCRGGGADDPNVPVGITVSQTYLTIANRSGSAFADGQIELVPAGVLAPYRMPMPRIESGATRDVQLDRFSEAGGARFRRGVARMQAVRIRDGYDREDLQAGGAVQLRRRKVRQKRTDFYSVRFEATLTVGIRSALTMNRSGACPM